MTIPAKLPLRGRANAYLGEEWQFTSGDAETMDEPVDLTGYTARVQFRLYGAQPGAAKIDLPSVTSDIEGVWILEPTQGRIQVYATKATMRSIYEALRGDIEPGADVRLVWDLILRAGDGREAAWAEGELTINPGVTQ